MEPKAGGRRLAPELQAELVLTVLDAIADRTFVGKDPPISQCTERRIVEGACGHQVGNCNRDVMQHEA